MLRWPGHTKPGESESLAHSIDLAPTILAAIGLKPGKGMEGVNLLDPHWVASRPAVYGEIFEHNAIDITKPAANLQYRWVIDGHWKLILPHAANAKGGKPELYDLAKDRHEKENLAATHAEKVRELTKKLDAWWKPE
jgi:uncharacterized sulfatase